MQHGVGLSDYDVGCMWMHEVGGVLNGMDEVTSLLQLVGGDMGWAMWLLGRDVGWTWMQAVGGNTRIDVVTWLLWLVGRDME
jgi:hypothetical protein